MDVQVMERTFVEKIFAICDYRIKNAGTRMSRHLYDICKLIGQVELNRQLDELIDKVREERMKSRNNPSAQLEFDIPAILREIIDSRFYEKDYREITQKLLYETISYDYAIEHGIAIVAESGIFEYKRDYNGGIG